MSTSSAPRERARESVTLSDGTIGELIELDGGWSLWIDRVRQSQVGPAGARPPLPASRWMLAALDARAPVSCAHIGGALLTLPRAVAERAPGSRQVVVELEPVLIDLARSRFGIPDGVTVRVGDGRAWLDTTTETDLDGVVIDVFTGGRIPPAFTSRECFGRAAEMLAHDGRLVVNSVAGPDLLFTRRQLATLREVFDHVAMIVRGSVLHGSRFGNAILVGSPSPLDTERIRAELAGDMPRASLVTAIDPLIDDAEPLRDAEQLWSPDPASPRRR